MIPEAIPLRSGGTTPIAVEASGGLISPTPAPATMKPANSAVQPEEAFSPLISSSPPPTNASPALSSSRTGTRSVRLPDTVAATNITSVVGKNRRPV